MNSSPPTSKPLTANDPNLDVFQQVIDNYHEYRAAQGTTGNAGTFGRSSNDSTGNAGGIISTSPSDFICDVETSARRGLTAPEYNFFYFVHIKQDTAFEENLRKQLGDDRYNSVDLRVRGKLGYILKERGVWPMREYFRPVDMR